MATMPGLPMFGHGQVEGFTEKYGMEFRKPLWDEQVDPYLVERHEREIFPILHRRAAFAGVENFRLYDVFTPEGSVNEDVFAYSNGMDNDRNLVIYHNKYGSTRGWVRTSVGFMDKTSHQIRQCSLGEGLNLHPGPNTFVIYRDHISGLEYLFPSKDVFDKGLYIELGAYKYHVFLDFNEVEDDEWQSYRQLYNYLEGRGVPAIQDAMRELLLQPVQQPFRQIANAGYLTYLLEHRLDEIALSLPPSLLGEAQQKLEHLMDGITYLTGNNQNREEISRQVGRELEAVLSLPNIDRHYPLPGSRLYPAAVQFIQSGLQENENRWLTLLAYCFTHSLGRLAGDIDFENQTISWFDEWQYGKLLVEGIQGMGISEESARRVVNQVKLLISQQRWFDQLGKKSLDQILEGWLAEDDVQRFLGVNRYKDLLWFNHEAFQDFLWCMMITAILPAMSDPALSGADVVERVLGMHENILNLQQAEEGSGFQVEKLLAGVKE